MEHIKILCKNQIKWMLTHSTFYKYIESKHTRHMDIAV